ncbi:hypothetical protein VKT23_006609 [Stygiomarasmius scandens]|uniref:Uncharacterized protein n=1 Tax=Marasmiellus scandens TaxID=2682957 RepID=A0ABR1JNC6_9AGAR
MNTRSFLLAPYGTNATRGEKTPAPAVKPPSLRGFSRRKGSLPRSQLHRSTSQNSPGVSAQVVLRGSEVGASRPSGRPIRWQSSLDRRQRAVDFGPIMMIESEHGSMLLPPDYQQVFRNV